MDGTPREWLIAALLVALLPGLAYAYEAVDQRALANEAAATAHAPRHEDGVAFASLATNCTNATSAGNATAAMRAASNHA